MNISLDPVGWWEGIRRPLRNLPKWGALAVLAALLGALVWSALAVTPLAQVQSARQEARSEAALGDLALYQRIHQRVAAGEDYYATALEEQRAGEYPTRPFVTVRLPTLAWANAAIGPTGVRIVAILLLAAVLAAFMFALRPLLSAHERVAALLFVIVSGAVVVQPTVTLIHEVLAGLLLSLALGLYRPHRWWPSLVAAMLALALREIAAPFVLLWLAFALSQRRWREAAAVAGVLLLFVGMLYLHYQGVEAHRLPGDRASPGWDAMAGPALPLLALARLTALLFLPLWLAAPLALLPVLGWIGLGGRLGLFATLWFAGFFLGMALFARPENFYWVQLTLPAYAAGFAFVPRALADLAGVVRGSAIVGPSASQT